MASEKRKLSLSKETLRTLSATALSQVAGGACYSSQYCVDTTGGNCGSTRTYAYGTSNWVCGPTECQTQQTSYGNDTSGFSGCQTNTYPTTSNLSTCYAGCSNQTYSCVTNSYC
jgi:hypothetical protein